MVEDSVDINKEFPYTDFLCMLHKLIRNKSQAWEGYRTNLDN